MYRRIACLVATGLTAVSVATPAGAAPPKVPDHMRAFSIVPPGQEGDVSTPELATSSYGPFYSDQLKMYASLVKDGNVTEVELPQYFHSMQFGPQGNIEDEYEPTDGVTVYRDTFGIPHIYADSFTNASFALGYVTAEDRMWQMDVFRNAARGTLAEFIGPSFLRLDIDTRREGYTEEEVQKMFDEFDDKFGKTGKTIQEGLQAYADGVNAHIEELKTTRLDEMPAEYAATGNPPPVFPREWSPLDTLFLAVLQLRVFGETAGFELENAGFYRHLTTKLGDRLGAEVFEDFLRPNDPRSYTSVPRGEGRFKSQRLGPVDPKSIAIPDGAKKEALEARALREKRAKLLAGMGFKSPASNALLVAPDESATGNPLEIGAPQVGYANPAFFIDVDVHAPGVDIRGPAVPGASALVPLGRGPDYAWTLTTGYSDAVDVRAEKLCNPDGEGKVTLQSNGYLFDGKCREMESRDEEFIVKPSPADPGAPSIESRTFYRTVHGPVFKRAKVGGAPVAFVKERFFWMQELDSIPAFYKWNVDGSSLSKFRAAARDFTMSFNAFYANHKHIGYFHVGLYPRRTPRVHPALPVWGTGRWEWRGRIPFFRHPKVVDPRQGWVANWNNKPAAGWDNYDAPKWGPIHRVELLADKMKRETKGRARLELSDIVDVIRRAATQDTRGLYLGPQMVRAASALAKSGSEDEAVSLVEAWIEAGAHRANENGDDDMDAGPAVAIFDTWYDKLVHKVFDDELGKDGYRLLPAPVFDHDMWFDFSSYLNNVFDDNARKRLARNYCDNIETDDRESCPKVIFAALQEALAELKEKQGDDMSAWTVPAEWIRFSNQGAGSVPEIPWQNRGTHNHVVEILRNA